MALDQVLSMLIANVTKLIPLRFHMVYDFQQGIHFWMGKAKKQLKPGLHVTVPFVGDIVALTTVEQVVETEHITVMTSDRKSATLSLAVAYQIEDLIKYFTKVQDFDQSLLNVAEREVNAAVAKRRASEVMEQRDAILEEVEEAVRTKASEWGTNVLNIGFVNFAVVPALRLFQDAAT